MDSTCQKCGRPLRPGTLKYRLKIELTSMFDGFLEEPEGDVDEEIEKLLTSVNRRDPEQLADDVAQTIQLVICRQCRNQLVKDYRDSSPRMFH